MSYDILIELQRRAEKKGVLACTVLPKDVSFFMNSIEDLLLFFSGEDL